jgi:hypothetical protein
MQAAYSLLTKEAFIWAAGICIELDNELNCLGAQVVRIKGVIFFPLEYQISCKPTSIRG